MRIVGRGNAVVAAPKMIGRRDKQNNPAAATAGLAWSRLEARSREVVVRGVIVPRQGIVELVVQGG